MRTGKALEARNFRNPSLLLPIVHIQLDDSEVRTPDPGNNSIAVIPAINLACSIATTGLISDQDLCDQISPNPISRDDTGGMRGVAWKSLQHLDMINMSFHIAVRARTMRIKWAISGHPLKVYMSVLANLPTRHEPSI